MAKQGSCDGKGKLPQGVDRSKIFNQVFLLSNLCASKPSTRKENHKKIEHAGGASILTKKKEKGATDSLAP